MASFDDSDPASLLPCWNVGIRVGILKFGVATWPIQ